MFIRAYLRASTRDQDATRAKDQIHVFAESHGHKIASCYIENESGAKLDRPELKRLLNDAQPGDVLLVEAVDRLSRLTSADWQELRSQIKTKGLRVVALDLPTSHQAMTVRSGDDFTGRMLDAVNEMLLDMLAAVARKDYEQRRERQKQGIEKAKADGKFKGRPADTEKHATIRKLLSSGLSIREVAKVAGCSTFTVQQVKKHTT